MENSNEEKLSKLKQMIVGYYLNEDVSFRDFEQIKLNWTTTEGFILLLSEEVFDMMLTKQKRIIRNVLRLFAIPLQSLEFSRVHLAIDILLKSILHQTRSSNLNDWDRHEAICFTMVTLFQQQAEWKGSKFFHQNALDLLYDYVMYLFDKCNALETIKWALLIVDRLCIEKLGNEKCDQLKAKLSKYSALESEFPHSAILNAKECSKYEVGFCARWCLDNLLNFNINLEQIPCIKLSNDRMSARNDSNHRPTIRSSFEITSGVYFYEAILLSEGSIHIGWTTRESKFVDSGGIGHDKYSIGLDSSDGILWYNSDCPEYYERLCSEMVYEEPKPCNGNVVGCLIDVDNRQFVFYLNGQVVKCLVEVHFSTMPYFAAATLSPNQHCYFNFGQTPFKFAPEGFEKFKNFHTVCNGDVSKFGLLTPVIVVNFTYNYCFLEDPTDNQIKPFFYDPTQVECDNLLTQTANDIQTNGKITKLNIRKLVFEELQDQIDQTKNDTVLLHEFKQIQISMLLQDKRVNLLRYLQSAIEMNLENQSELSDHTINLLACSIGDIIDEVIDQVRSEKFYELIFPYLQLSIVPKKDVLKHRNLCIILTYIAKYAKYYEYFKLDFIRKFVFSYLVRVLTESEDDWTRIFALICLDDLGVTEGEKIQIQKNVKLTDLLVQWQEGVLDDTSDYFERLRTNKECLLRFQLWFSAHQFIRNNFQTEQQPQPRNSPKEVTAVLDPVVPQHPFHEFGFRCPTIKLSPNRLSARGDWQWQSVRSIYLANECIYYYEVLLLTSGPMRLGWATKRTDLNKTKIGEDEFSIAFDGYNRCVWQDGIKHEIDIESNWKVGDIVGCLINFRTEQFGFSLNGQQIELPLDLYFSSLPYNAAVSLSTHQQVYFNFGQTRPFIHRPKRVEYFDFCFTSKDNKLKLEDGSGNQSNSFAFGNIDKSIVSIDSKLDTKGNIQIQQSAQELINDAKASRKRKLETEDDDKCIICPTCKKQIPLEHLRSELCEHLELSTFDTNKGEKVKLIPKTFTCHLCDQLCANGNAIQFVGCDHWILCRGCLPSFNYCTKCHK